VQRHPEAVPRQMVHRQTVLDKNFTDTVWTWWRFGRVDAYRPKGHEFDSCSSRHVGTLGKSFTHSCHWRFGVKFRHSIRVNYTGRALVKLAVILAPNLLILYVDQ